MAKVTLVLSKNELTVGCRGINEDEIWDSLDATEIGEAVIEMSTGKDFVFDESEDEDEDPSEDPDGNPQF